MHFGQMIEKGIEIHGTQRKLAAAIDQPESALSDARKGKRGLPDAACAKLAQIVGLSYGQVSAARNEWTAKTEEERNFWHPLANAAGIAAISLCFVTSLLTPSPAQASPAQGLRSTPLCIM